MGEKFVLKYREIYLEIVGGIIIFAVSGLMGNDCLEKPETKFMHGRVQHVRKDFLTKTYTIMIEGYWLTSFSSHVDSVGFGDENITGKIGVGDYIIVYVEWECVESCINPNWHYWVPFAKDWKIIEWNTDKDECILQERKEVD